MSPPTGTTSPEFWPWIWIAVAGVLEIGWAIGLKYSAGFTKVGPSVVTVVLMCLSFYCLAQGAKSLPIGTAYAVWTGMGAAGTAILGMILFKEPSTGPRLACVMLIVIGIIGLKLTHRPDRTEFGTDRGSAGGVSAGVSDGGVSGGGEPEEARP